MSGRGQGWSSGVVSCALTLETDLRTKSTHRGLPPSLKERAEVYHDDRMAETARMGRRVRESPRRDRTDSVLS